MNPKPLLSSGILKIVQSHSLNIDALLSAASLGSLLLIILLAATVRVYITVPGEGGGYYHTHSFILKTSTTFISVDAGCS